MKSYVWLTDIHLNFIDEPARYEFYRQIVDTKCDGVFITGDIADAESIEDILTEMANAIRKPIYFVLGNHDFYGGEVQMVRQQMEFWTEYNEYLFWVPKLKLEELAEGIVLVGQDGWADGRLGDYENSHVTLNDSSRITDLFRASLYGKQKLLEKMRYLADVDAKALERDIKQAFAKKPTKIIILTHVPPFKEACLYNGKISNDDFLPFFSSKVMGDLFMEVATKNPKVEFHVLCGHTHGEASYQPLDNLLVMVGKADYGKPKIQRVIVL